MRWKHKSWSLKLAPISVEDNSALCSRKLQYSFFSTPCWHNHSGALQWLVFSSQSQHEDRNRYKLPDTELEEVGTLRVPSNYTAEKIKQTWMQKGCLPDSTGNRKVKQAFLNKLSFQEHEQQQFLFINQSRKAPPSYPFLCSPWLQLCPPCKQEISIIYTYISVRSSTDYEKDSVQKYTVQSLNLF